MLPLMGTDSATADIKDAGALASSVSPLAIAIRPALTLSGKFAAFCVIWPR